MKKVEYLSPCPLPSFSLCCLLLRAFMFDCSTGLTYEQYAAQYGERTGLIMALRLDDAFRSWWFIGLSVILCVNLLCAAT